MNKYKTVYPVFEDIIITIIVLINQRIEFRKISNAELVFLEKVKDQLEILLKKLVQKPAISNVNIENLVNDCYRNDPSLHVVNVYIAFVKEPDNSRSGLIKINISK